MPLPLPPTTCPYTDLTLPLLVQDVIDAEHVPLGAPASVVKFCPDKMPEYWVADLVKREVKSLDAEDWVDAEDAMDATFNAEDLMDLSSTASPEVKMEVEDEKVQARVGPLQV